MRAIDIRICHDHHFMIADFFWIHAIFGSLPTPAPIAVIKVPISAENILSSRARSTFRILPRKGSIA